MRGAHNRDFPNLRRLGYTLTSRRHWHNCIAYAAGDFENRWWPSGHLPKSRCFWPPGIPWNRETVDVFIQAFTLKGIIDPLGIILEYEVCKDNNSSWEHNIEKVAIYALNGEVTHMARQQVSTGKWRSKLGKSIDLEHTLEGLEGPLYGKVVAILKRQALCDVPLRKFRIILRLRTIAKWFKRNLGVARKK